MAGYSGTPLWKKLGIKPGHRVELIGAPMSFTVPDLPDATAIHRRVSRGTSDVILLFATKLRELDHHLASARSRLATDGGLWICWPKKASGVDTELNDGVVRAQGLSSGLVDNKVCAVDETWSGLRFVYRLRDRPKAQPPTRKKPRPKK